LALKGLLLVEIDPLFLFRPNHLFPPISYFWLLNFLDHLGFLSGGTRSLTPLR